MAAAAIARGIPLWLSSPIVELHQAGRRTVGAVIDKEGKPVEVTARLGVVLARGGFPGNDDLTRRLYAHRRAGKNHATLPPCGNASDGLRLAQSVGGRLRDAVHQPAAWTPVSLVPQPDGALYRFRISTSAVSPATSALIGVVVASPTSPNPITSMSPS